MPFLILSSYLTLCHLSSQHQNNAFPEYLKKKRETFQRVRRSRKIKVWELFTLYDWNKKLKRELSDHNCHKPQTSPGTPACWHLKRIGYYVGMCHLPVFARHVVDLSIAYNGKPHLVIVGKRFKLTTGNWCGILRQPKCICFIKRFLKISWYCKIHGVAWCNTAGNYKNQNTTHP